MRPQEPTQLVCTQLDSVLAPKYWTSLERPASNKPSGLFGSFISYEQRIFCHLISPEARNRGMTQTLDHGMMRRAFYHCATATGHLYSVTASV